MTRDKPSIDLTRRHSLQLQAMAAFEEALNKSLKAGLYLVATPIGNLSDITIRALGVLANAGVVYCEDTRHSRKLLTRYGISCKLKVYEEHNAKTQRSKILAALEAGLSVALISDAGTPLISDPGYKLVREVIAAGMDVFSVPGPSAAISSLAVSGLPTDKFFFQGFLPAKSAGRRSRLKELASLSTTIVLYETPNRLATTLHDAAKVLGNRKAAVAREITKLHEEIIRGDLAELAEWADKIPLRGEMSVVIGPPTHSQISDEAIRNALTSALENSSFRDATRDIAEILGVSRKRVYELGLGLGGCE